MAFESFQSEKMQRLKKIESTSAITGHSGYLESFLAAPKDQTTFFASTIYYCRGFRERLETLTCFATANNHCRNLREGLKTLNSFAPINNYCCYLKKGLETYTSSAPTNNYCRSLKKGLEIQLIFTTFFSFVNSSNLLQDISSNIEPAKIGYTFWREYCQRFKIKHSIPATCSLAKYI